jgi:hypothetical protein
MNPISQASSIDWNLYDFKITKYRAIIFLLLFVEWVLVGVFGDFLRDFGFVMLWYLV